MMSDAMQINDPNMNQVNTKHLRVNHQSEGNTMWKDGKAKFNDEIAMKHESNRQLADFTNKILHFSPFQQGMFT
jgi:hypothetical protein